jgi:hypothetical protein
VNGGSSRKLLIFVVALALFSAGLSPLALTHPASAATTLDWTDAHGPGNGDAPAMVWDDTHKILYRATSGKGVWKYQGGTWTSLGGAVSSLGITSLAYDDTGNKLYAGTNAQGVWCYNASGGTWTNIATVEVMPYYITSMAWGGGKLYAGCWDPNIVGKGVWCYDPSGGTWTDTGGGVTTSRIISLAWGDNKLYAGCLFNDGHGEVVKGVWCYDPGPGPGVGTWSDTDGALVSLYYVYSLAWDTNHDLLYAGVPNQGLFYYNPASPDLDKWTDCRLPNFGITALAYDSEQSRIYVGRSDPASVNYSGVWFHNDGDPFALADWTNTGGGVNTFEITSLAYGEYDMFNQFVYAGAPGKGVWSLRVSDSSPAWSDTGGGVSSFYTLSLAWDASHNLLYAGTAAQGVWCYDSSTHTWSDTGGAVSSYAILSLAWGGGKLYAGCRDPSLVPPVGVWCYDPSTHLWSDTGGGVSTFKINSFAFDTSHNLLYAGTEGHGVWRYDPASGLADKWSATGGGMSTFNVTSLVMGGGKLYAGCYDTVPGYEGVWSYDPANPGLGWTNTDGGVGAFQIYCLAWSGQKLYAGCWDPNLASPKGVWCYNPASGLADKWSDVGGPVVSGFRIYCLSWGGGKLYASCNDWASSTLEGAWCYDPASTAPDKWSDTGGG